MDASKVIKAIEDLAVEVAVWVLLLPKTFVAVFRSPAQVVTGYEASLLSGQLQDERYLEPVRFWFLLGPAILLLDQWLTSNERAAVAIFGQSFEKMAAVATLILFIAPLAYAWQISIERALPLTRSNLQNAFRMQCYPFGVASFIFFVGGLILRWSEPLSAVFMLGAFIWHFYAQMVIARSDSRIVFPLGYVFHGGFKMLLLFAVLVAISGAFYSTGKLG